jgi:hypothetical protein
MEDVRAFEVAINPATRGIEAARGVTSLEDCVDIGELGNAALTKSR